MFWACLSLQKISFAPHFLAISWEQALSPPPPETFFQSLNLTHHDMSKFKLLASQTLQRLSGIFLKFFIETPLAYFF